MAGSPRSLLSHIKTKTKQKRTSGSSSSVSESSQLSQSNTTPTISEHPHSAIAHIEPSDADPEIMRRILAKRYSDLDPFKKSTVNLLEIEHFGLLVNYACIGFLNGLLPAIIYPFFKLYLNMESYQVSAASTMIMLPWSYKTFFGILSDHYPIFGIRRKAYILLGWLVGFIALMVLSYSQKVQAYYASGEIQRTEDINLRVVQNHHAPEAGARYLIELLVVCLGYVIAEVACDGIMVELAQHEHIEIRGSTQSTIYIVRFTGNLVGGLVAAIGFNGQDYGGSFSWSIPYEMLFFGCAIITIIGSVCTVCFLVEETYYPHLDQHPFQEMWRIVQQKAIWQMMAFHFLNAFLNNFGFSGFSAIQEYWVHVQPLNNSLATCFSTLLFVAATILMKLFFLNASWRTMMMTCTLLSSISNYSVALIVIHNIVRNQWFFLGGPQLAQIPDGMRHVIAGFVTVEIAEHGFEGATYSLLTTVHNLATPFAASMSNLVDSLYSVSDQDIATDSNYVRGQVLICVSICFGLQLLSLCTLILLPRQKLEAQELKYHGSSSGFAGGMALLVVVFALIWATVTSVLAVRTETACMRIAGGPGCL